MLKRITFSLCLLLLTTACSAQDNSKAPYTDGNQYVTIASPQRYSDKGKVEVVEVFSYGCIHCAHFAPYMDKLEKSLPEGVVVHYVPAVFSQAWEPYARAFYAAQELGVLKATHDEVFKAKFQYNYPINSLSDLADFYSRHGVKREAFLRAAKSAETDRRMAADTRLAQRWGVDATPTIVVDGKYRSNRIHSFDELVSLTRWLVKRELASKKP